MLNDSSVDAIAWGVSWFELFEYFNSISSIIKRFFLGLFWKNNMKIKYPYFVKKDNISPQRQAKKFKMFKTNRKSTLIP